MAAGIAIPLEQRIEGMLPNPNPSPNVAPGGAQFFLNFLAMVDRINENDQRQQQQRPEHFNLETLSRAQRTVMLQGHFKKILWVTVSIVLAVLVETILLGLGGEAFEKVFGDDLGKGIFNNIPGVTIGFIVIAGTYFISSLVQVIRNYDRMGRIDEDEFFMVLHLDDDVDVVDNEE